MDEGTLEGNTLRVEIPHCAILYLRSSRFTPDKLQIQISTPGGQVTFDVHAMKLQEYTIEEIFEKKLFMLIPFYIFSYEKHFEEYNTNEERLSELQAEYAKIVTHLDGLVEQEKLKSYEYCMMVDMSKRVLEGIAARYENVRKGVGEVLGGRVLETEWDKRYRAGENEKAKQIAFKLRDMGMGDNDIACVVEVSASKVREWFEPVKV